jgi:hypothetical protein
MVLSSTFILSFSDNFLKHWNSKILKIKPYANGTSGFKKISTIFGVFEIETSGFKNVIFLKYLIFSAQLHT